MTTLPATPAPRPKRLWHQILASWCITSRDGARIYLDLTLLQELASLTDSQLSWWSLVSMFGGKGGSHGLTHFRSSWLLYLFPSHEPVGTVIKICTLATAWPTQLRYEVKILARQQLFRCVARAHSLHLCHPPRSGEFLCVDHARPVFR